MLRLLNIAIFGAVVLVAVFLYRIEHTTRQAERDIARFDREIARERERIKMLQADWSYLTSPERLQRLVAEHSPLQPAQPNQVISRDELKQRLPEISPPDPAALTPVNPSPIAEMVKALQQ